MLLENKKLLAEGGFGHVYQGCKTFKGKEVVVKIMSTDANIYTSFLREKLMARVIHPFLMPIFAISEGHDTCCLMYPFMLKKDLRGVLDADEDLTDNLPYRDRLKILFQVATALYYLHTPVRHYRLVHKFCYFSIIYMLFIRERRSITPLIYFIMCSTFYFSIIQRQR